MCAIFFLLIYSCLFYDLMRLCRNYRGLKQLVKQISGQSLWVQSSSSTAEPRPSKVNSHADERSFAGSRSLHPDGLSDVTLPAEPINELDPKHRLFASITYLGAQDPLIRSDTISCSDSTLVNDPTYSGQCWLLDSVIILIISNK